METEPPGVSVPGDSITGADQAGAAGRDAGASAVDEGGSPHIEAGGREAKPGSAAADEPAGVQGDTDDEPDVETSSFGADRSDDTEDADGDADAGPDVPVDGDADAGPDVPVDGDADAGQDAPVDGDADAGLDADAVPDANADSDADAGPAADAGSGADAGSSAAAGSDADAAGVSESGGPVAGGRALPGGAAAEDGEAPGSPVGGTAAADETPDGEVAESRGVGVAHVRGAPSIGVAHVKIPGQRSAESARVGAAPMVEQHSVGVAHVGGAAVAEQRSGEQAHAGGAAGERHNVGVQVGASSPVVVPQGMDVLPADTVRPYHKRVWVWLLAFVVVVLVGGGVAVIARPAVKKSPDGTTVLGVAVGGLDEAALRKKVDGSVAPLLGRAITVTASTQTFDLTPTAAGVALDRAATVTAAMNGSGAMVSPVLTVNTKVLAAKLAAHKKAAVEPVAKLASPPAGLLDKKEDASFTASGKGVSGTRGSNGWKVDPKKGVAAFVAAVKSGAPSVAVPVVAVKPKNKPVDQLIGIFTTYHPCCAARVTNIHQMARLVDGTVVKPGATFALDKFAGERTTAKGFVPAPAIDEGKLVQQVGGGVSQFSTTLYNAIWFAGLPSLTHQPHSQYIGRYPPGREATLDWQSIDNVFKNTTSTPIVIRASYTGTSLTVALYGHTGDRKVVSTTAPYSPSATGFSVSVTRKVYAGDKVTGTRTTHWTYTGID